MNSILLENYLTSVINSMGDTFIKSNDIENEPTWKTALDNYNNIKSASKESKESKDVIAFANGLDNEWLFLKQHLNKELSMSDLPYAAALVPVYMNRKKYENKKKYIQNWFMYIKDTSRYIGDVKTRINIHVMHIDKVIFDNKYGGGYIYNIIDYDGNLYQWVTRNELDEDIEYITGRVKKYQEYMGVKQTVLNYVKVPK